MKYEVRLTCVCSLMGLQMGAFRVDFFATDELAFMYPSFGVGTVIVLSLVDF